MSVGDQFFVVVDPSRKEQNEYISAEPLIKKVRGLCEVGLDINASTAKSGMIVLLLLDRPSWVYARSVWTAMNSQEGKKEKKNVEMYMVAVGSSLVGLCEVGLDSSASTTKSSLIDYFVVGLSLAGLCEIGLDSKGFQGKNR